MKLENQITSLELSRQLKEAGVETDTHFYWCEFTYYNDERELITDWVLKDKKQQIKEVGLCFSAFTCSELGELLPISHLVFTRTVGRHKIIIRNIGKYKLQQKSGIYFFADTEVECRGKMLLYLVQNKLINPL